LWHVVYEEKLTSAAGHFGPINELSFFPSGKMIASGSENGFVRLDHVDVRPGTRRAPRTNAKALR